MPAKRRRGLSVTDEIGIAYSEFDRSGRGDAEFVPALRGQLGTRIYRQMAENDATIASIIFAIEMSIRHADWRIEPNIRKEASKKDLDFMRSALFEDTEHSFEDFISEAISFLIYGWSIHEKVYKIRNGSDPDPTKNSLFSDGRIGLRKISLRPQSSLYLWNFDDKTGRPTGFQQFTRSRGIVNIPLNKCVYFRTTGLEGAPEGRSILRGAYRSWYFMRHLEQVESTAIERELNGLPVLYIPGELLSLAKSDPDAAATVALYEAAARDVKLNKQGSLVLPSDVYTDQDGSLTTNRKVIFELASSTGTRNIDMSSVISRYQANIMRTVLADFVLIGSAPGTSGSYSLTVERSQLFADALGGWLDQMTSTINRSLVTPLWEINGLPKESAPQLMHGSISRESLATIANYVQTLSAAGMPLFPDEGLEDYLRKQADLPPAAEELASQQEADLPPKDKNPE